MLLDFLYMCNYANTCIAVDGFCIIIVFLTCDAIHKIGNTFDAM